MIVLSSLMHLRIRVIARPRRTSTRSSSVLPIYLISWWSHILPWVSCHCYVDDIQLILTFPPSDTLLRFHHVWQTCHHGWQLNSWHLILAKLNFFSSQVIHQHVRIWWSTWLPDFTFCHYIQCNRGINMDNQLSFYFHIANLLCSCQFFC